MIHLNENLVQKNSLSVAFVSNMYIRYVRYIKSNIVNRKHDCSNIFIIKLPQGKAVLYYLYTSSSYTSLTYLSLLYMSILYTSLSFTTILFLS